MSDHETYADWVRSVRAEARRSLRSLRQDRLARRSSPGRAAVARSPQEALAEELPILVSRQTADMVRSEVGDPLSVAASQAPKAADVTGDGAGAEPMQHQGETSEARPTGGDAEPQQLPGDAESAGEQADHEAPQAPAMAPTSPEAPCADVSSETAEAPDSTLCWTEAELRASSLNRLPGAGIGLVWLLHANGIGSLEQLTTADAVRLTQGLGLVGQLVDVQDWIDFAKSELGGLDSQTPLAPL